MYDKLISRGVEFMFSYGNVAEENREVYRYGLELIFMYLINAGALLILGIIFGRFFETLLLLACFALLQSFAGGYHAMTHLRCFLLMLLLWGISMATLWLISPGSFLFDLFAVACLVTVYRIAPVQHKNYPLSEEKANRMKKIARCIAWVFCGMVLLGHVFPVLSGFSAVVGITLLMSSVSMIGAYLKQSRENHCCSQQ